MNENLELIGQFLNSVISLAGAAGFGYVIGWFTYMINRYRTGDVSFADLTTLVGILGGGVILSLFPAGTALFGAYGIGLAFGFFSYFNTLRAMVNASEYFGVEWFLDGRRKLPPEGWYIPEGYRETVASMGSGEETPTVRSRTPRGGGGDELPDRA